MRHSFRSPPPALFAGVLVALASALACSLISKSPALSNPLHDQLAKAELPSIEDATKACLTKEGWKPDDIGSIAEGSTVVTAKNSAKDQISVYIHGEEVSPRVTGGPGYGDPFWSCLGKELAGGGGKPAPSAEDPAEKPDKADKP
jgi:hypothetical protein